MKRTGLLLFISQLVVLGLCSTPQAPKWPSQFEVCGSGIRIVISGKRQVVNSAHPLSTSQMSYTLSLPYVSSLQPGGLK
jgi:hypothetical protein